MSNALTARRSIRKFQPTPVSPDTIRAIVAVAAYAPSWKNSQTTRYTLLTKREEIDRVADECTMGFQKNIDTLHGAPALVVLTTVNDRSGYERDGSFSTSKGTHTGSPSMRGWRRKPSASPRMMRGLARSSSAFMTKGRSRPC